MQYNVKNVTRPVVQPKNLLKGKKLACVSLGLQLGAESEPSELNYKNTK